MYLYKNLAQFSCLGSEWKQHNGLNEGDMGHERFVTYKIIGLMVENVHFQSMMRSGRNKLQFSGIEVKTYGQSTTKVGF